MTRFEVITAIAAPPHRVFDLSLQVEVHTSSMAGSGERAIGASGRMRLGDTVTWQARHLGVRWRMTVLISVFEPPGHFVDEQVAGPFKRWRHAQKVEEIRRHHHCLQVDGHVAAGQRHAGVAVAGDSLDDRRAP